MSTDLSHLQPKAKELAKSVQDSRDWHLGLTTKRHEKLVQAVAEQLRSEVREQGVSE